MTFILYTIFLLSRLIFLTKLPIFNDEATTIHNANIFFQNPSVLYYLIPDGRGPLVPITTGITQFLPLDPLVAARLLQILWGLIAFIATLAVGRILGFSAWLQKMLAVFLITSPFLMFFDRLVLPNGFVAAIGMICLWVTLSLREKPTIGRGILLGLAIATGWWYFSLILVLVPGLLAIVLLSEHIWRDWKKYLVAIGVGGIVFFLLIAPILANPIYQQITSTSPKRFFSVQELGTFPVTKWLGTGVALLEWYVGYMTPIVFGLFLVGIFAMVKERKFRGLALFTLFPILAIIFLVDATSARNQQVIVPSMLLISVYGLGKIKWKQFVSILAIITATAISVVAIVFPHALYDLFYYLPAAGGDTGQYTRGWPSGYGVKEAADFLITESKKEPIAVFVRFDSGNPEDGMFVYLYRKNIPVAYVPASDPVGYVEKIHERYPHGVFYFVSRGSQLGGLQGHLKEVIRFKKPNDSEFVGIYKIEI